MANDIVFKQDGNLFDDVSEIVESAQKFAYQSVDRILVLSMAPLFAESIKRIHFEQSISNMFE